MRDARAQMMGMAELNRTDRIGEALKLDILGREAADRRRCAPGVAVNTFEAGPVALVPEAGKPDAGLLARPAAEEAYLDRVETDAHYGTDALDILIDKVDTVIINTAFAITGERLPLSEIGREAVRERMFHN